MKIFLFILSISITTSLFSQTAKDYYNLGIEQKNLGEIGKASEYFNKSLKANPKFYLSKFELGKLYIIAKSYDLANDAFDKVIETAPSFPDVYLERGKMFIDYADFKNACQDFKKAKDLGNKEVQKYIDQYCK